jgi:hypothetical protein
VGLSIMLRTYFVQQWFNPSDPRVEEALYESQALRRFVVSVLLSSFQRTTPNQIPRRQNVLVFGF